MLLKNYKRCLSFVLALALVLSLIPMFALAAEEDPNGQIFADTAAGVSEPAKETTISTETSEPPSELEGTNSAAVEEIQARINAVLTQYGITAEMSDREIGDAIILADGDTIQATMEEMSAIEEAALAMTENEFLQLDTELYGRFCSVMDQLFQPAILAITTTVLDGQVSITDTANKNTESSGTVTIEATGSLFSKSTNTVTITNETASMATLAFDYSASTYSSFTIAGTSANASGTYSVKLAPGASLTLALQSNRGWSNLTATLKLSNFSLTAATNTYSLAFEFDANYGSISVGGTSYTDGTASAENVPEASGIAVTATTKNNSTFLGWVNTEDGKRLSSAASFTLLPDANMTVKAVFVSSTSDAWFLVDNQYMYDDLDTSANRANASKVVLMHSGTLQPNKNDKNETVPYIIPPTVTLVIPHDADGTIITTEPPIIQNTQSVKVYRTLTMASGASITLNGSMSIAASLTASQTTGHNGLPTGNVSQVKMEEGSSITVGSTGKLYAIGYIYGSGSVEVKSSGTVYECFQLRDFRGGSATSSMNGSRKTYRLFPLMQYYVQNIQVPMTLNAGAVEQGIGAFAISQILGNPKPTHTTIPFIGSSGMFNITFGKVVKDYDEDTDRLVIEADADLEVNSYEFPIAVQGFTTTLKTADYILPLNHNITVNMKSGSLSINQDLSLLPGAEILIQEGVTCTLGSGTEIIVYDRDNWGTYCGERLSSSITNTEIKPLLYIAGGNIHPRTWVATPDASVMVNGTVDATKGYLYTTTGGANVYSTGTGKIIGVTAGTLTTAYQATQNGSSITYVEIGVTPAKLKHENGEFLETTGASATTYNHDHYTCLEHGDTSTDSTAATCGKWYAGAHSLSEVETPPTCITHGYTTYTCSCGHAYTGNETDLAAHTPAAAVQENVTAATCLEPGSYDSVVYCSTSDCDTELSRTTVNVPAAGHSYENGVCKVCGCVEVSFTIAHNLALKELVQIGYWVQAESAAEIKDVGILIWDEAAYFAEDKHDINSETAVNPAMTSRQGFMMGYGEGIYAQYLDTKYYAVPYVVTSDGSYVYSGTPDIYAAPTYAQQMRNQTDKVKTVVYDLLNYGTYAQLYFDSREDGKVDITNRINDVLEDAQKVLRYDESMLVTEITAEKAAEKTNSQWLWRYSTVDLLAAIQLNFHAVQSNAFDKMLYWNEESYDAADTLTAGNATTMLSVSDRTVSSDPCTSASISNIYPRDIDKWHYACMYNSTDNTYGPLRVDSIACYLSRMINNYASYAGQENTNGYLLETCKAMLAYGDSAKAYAGQ